MKITEYQVKQQIKWHQVVSEQFYRGLIKWEFNIKAENTQLFHQLKKQVFKYTTNDNITCLEK